jgi:hypothetical protein
MKATFSIFHPTTLKVRDRYVIEYNDREELIGLFEEARQVWDNYLVMMQDGQGGCKVSQVTYFMEVVRESNQEVFS